MRRIAAAIPQGRIGPLAAIGGGRVASAVHRHPDCFRIELLQRPEAAMGPLDNSGSDEATLTLGYGHLCSRSSDVAADHDRLVALSAVSRIAPRTSPNRPGATICFLADPWGNLPQILGRPEERA
ncbi:hypothetical protein [Nocardioides sp. KR10-350]|uniref:VOC family protein n=1 Tax=Nocardioides cheoyonin TaxID=3156615 RepID=UPI0032B478EB